MSECVSEKERGKEKERESALEGDRKSGLQQEITAIQGSKKDTEGGGNGTRVQQQEHKK